MNELIEYLRYKMIDLAEQRGSLTHPEVVAVSEQLDEYIVQAQQIRKQNSGRVSGKVRFTTRGIHGFDWLTDFVAFHDSSRYTVTRPPS